MEPRPVATTGSETFRFSSGTELGSYEIVGENAITALHVKLLTALGKEKQAEFLSEAVIRIFWDGEKKPSVWSPLGDFFGTTPGVNQYKSLPLGMTDDGFYSYWYMPFEKGAVIEIANDGDIDCEVLLTVTHTVPFRPAKELGRFHAKWHRDAFMPEEPERWIDWPMLKTQGRGRFVGVMLHVYQPKMIGWWGEGDEKFFVDGEKFPSTFGTGSEDYFGYAWGGPQLFAHPYHTQTHNPNRHIGHVCDSRFHITDNIPFESSFEGDIEKYWKNTETNPKKPFTLYAATAYWYLAPGQTDGYEPVPVQQRTGQYKFIYRTIGRNDGPQTLGTLHQLNPQRQVQVGRTRPWSFLWQDVQPGEKIEVAPSPFDDRGSYEVIITLTRGPDCGKVQVCLNGERLGEPIDLYKTAPRAERDKAKKGKKKSLMASYDVTEPISFGVHKLKKTGNVFTLEAIRDHQQPISIGLSTIEFRWVGED